jgi:hypothetical protein
MGFKETDSGFKLASDWQQLFAGVTRWYIYLTNKNPNFGIIWEAWEWILLEYFTTFGVFYGHLLYFIDIWYIL